MNRKKEKEKGTILMRECYYYWLNHQEKCVVGERNLSDQKASNIKSILPEKEKIITVTKYFSLLYEQMLMID